MSYKVLARKWRPDHFDEVVGQQHVARTLINSIEQERVAHAYLFCGARGVGKTSTARILAKAMNCEEGPAPRPCYDCPSCEEISEGQSVDVFEIDGASNRGINEIRELREGVRYAPSRDRHKIYIIDEVHMLTTEAFNALLKTLEEPPEHALFIFATTEPQKIPVTILSRCQRFDFKRISQRDIVDHLEKLCDHEGLDAQKAALQIIARQANGGMRDALSLLDQIISFAGDQITEREIAEILGVANRKHLFELSEAVLDRDAEQALVVLDEVNRYGYDLQQFASELVTHFRDLMVTAVVEDPEMVTQLTESELQQAYDQVQGAPAELLHRYFSVMVEGAERMSRSAYPKLIFEMTLVRLSKLEPMEQLDVLVDRLELLEQTFDGDAAGVDWPQPGSDDDGGGSVVYEDDQSDPEDGDAEHTDGEASAQPGSKPEGDDHTPPQTSQQGQPPGKAKARDASPSRAPKKQTADALAEPERSDTDSPRDSATDRSDPQMPPVEAYEASHPAGGGDTAAVVARTDEQLVKQSKPAADTDGSSPPGADAPVQEKPKIPKPLSPAGQQQLEVPDVDGIDDPQRRWEILVGFVRKVHAPTAATCEHAYLERFDDGTLAVRFPEEYIDFARDERRREVLVQAVCRVFGDHWDVDIELEDHDDPTGGKTLAQKRQEKLERRRNELEQKMRDCSAVKTARELFDADEPNVSVRLYEE